MQHALCDLLKLSMRTADVDGFFLSPLLLLVILI